MPRVQPRLYAIVVLSSAVACTAPPTRRAEERSATSGTRAFASAGAAAPSATSAAAASPDSSIEGTVAAVTNDVKAIRDAPPAAVASKLPAHEKLVNGMLDTFESRIRAMHVEADPAWTSVIDSVRTDLTRLPAMPSQALATFLPQHLNRVMRIVVCIQMVKG